MYNSNSWAVPNSVLDKLDITHRRHLRHLLNYRYPHIISNENLYKRCKTVPLSARVTRSRWRMLGHVLRGPEDGPAFYSMKFAVNTLNLPGRRGRPQSNLFSLIKRDLDNNMFLRNSVDLFQLRSVAQDRAHWRSIYSNDWFCWCLLKIRCLRCHTCDYHSLRTLLYIYIYSPQTFEFEDVRYGVGTLWCNAHHARQYFATT